jgi:hypothetical protein
LRFNWRGFLRQHRIEFQQTEAQKRRGRINVPCPMCGPSEEGLHMGIRLNGRGWSCWRNSGHRGENDASAVRALLGCSSEEAHRIVSEGSDTPIPQDMELADLRRKLLGAESVPKTFELMPEFKPLASGSMMAEPFWEYLREERGYRDRQITWLAQTYDLYYTIRGAFAYRIIIPIRDRYGRLLNWTGRTIRKDEELRYKNAPLKHETLPTAVCSDKDTVLGLPLLWQCPNPRVLLVCEGPFDAMWVTLYGYGMGVYGTCLFGLNMTSAQMSLLHGLRTRFPQQYLLIDSAARNQSFRLANNGYSIGVLELEDRFKDPAVMPPQDVIKLCLRALS